MVDKDCFIINLMLATNVNDLRYLQKRYHIDEIVYSESIIITDPKGEIYADTAEQIIDKT